MSPSTARLNVLLTGATGFIGRNVAAVLGAAGHRVVPASRASGCDFAQMRTPADWRPHLAGIDAVINAVGIIGERGRQCFAALHATAPIALFRACAEAGVRRVVQVSALGADATAFSAYHQNKRAADDVLRSLDLDGFVLRPALIYGRGSRSAALFLRLARLPRLPLIGDGQQVIQPVHIGDVVATVLHALVAPAARCTLDVVGPQTTTFATWLQMMRAAQGLPPARTVAVPLWLALASARLARHWSPPLHPDNLRMLQHGYHADPAPLADFLGRPPVAPAPRLFFTDCTTTAEAT